MSGDQKTKTAQSIHGSWYYLANHNGQNINIILSITKEKLVINNYIANIYRDGQEISSNAHWYGDYLMFTEGQKYFVRYADEDEMVFGEFAVPGVIGASVWKYEFTRMKSQ